MKFLVDAQLPLRLARWLNQTGHDALHTVDLPSANRTTDDELVATARSADRERRRASGRHSVAPQTHEPQFGKHHNRDCLRDHENATPYADRAVLRLANSNIDAIAQPRLQATTAHTASCAKVSPDNIVTFLERHWPKKGPSRASGKALQAGHSGYAPRIVGSRFRARGEPGVPYGAALQRTACAEAPSSAAGRP